MKSLLIYIHGKGGNAREAEHYKPLFPDFDVVGFDYKAETPWQAKSEFAKFLEDRSKGYEQIYLVANSIGAYFAMMSLSNASITKAYFISPMVKMEKLICDMMMWAGVSEDELREKKTIATNFGETLSWEYLSYVRENPVHWTIPTRILYGTKDNLVSLETITEFAGKIHASLAVMEGGEHWFHTDEQMEFLDEWIRNAEWS